MPVSNADFFNNLRDYTSAQFQARIPAATATNLDTIGQMLTSGNYNAEFNEWLTSLNQQIALDLLKSMAYNNRFGRFKKGTLTHGNYIRETFVEIPEGKSFEDVALVATNPFTIENPEIQTHYHRRNRRDYYKVTTRAEQLRTAFTNEYGVQRLINEIIATLNTANEVDEMIIFKWMLSYYVNTPDMPLQPNQIIEIDDLVDDETVRKFMISLTEAINALTIDPTTLYNPAQVLQYNRKEELTLVLSARYAPVVDVRTLSNAYNMGKVNYALEPFLVNDFGEDTEDIIAMLIPTDFWLVYNNLQQSGIIWNPEGLYWNHFQHYWNYFSASYFENVIIWTKDGATRRAFAIEGKHGKLAEPSRSSLK